MKQLKVAALVISISLFSIQLTQAQTPKEKDPAKRFAKLDTNSDGYLDKTEFAAAASKRKTNKSGKEIDPEKRFARIDTDSDGLISLSEFTSRPKKRRK